MTLSSSYINVNKSQSFTAITIRFGYRKIIFELATILFDIYYIKGWALSAKVIQKPKPLSLIQNLLL